MTGSITLLNNNYHHIVSDCSSGSCEACSSTTHFARCLERCALSLRWLFSISYAMYIIESFTFSRRFNKLYHECHPDPALPDRFVSCSSRPSKRRAASFNFVAIFSVLSFSRAAVLLRRCSCVSSSAAASTLSSKSCRLQSSYGPIRRTIPSGSRGKKFNPGLCFGDLAHTRFSMRLRVLIMKKCPLSWSISGYIAYMFVDETNLSKNRLSAYTKKYY